MSEASDHLPAFSQPARLRNGTPVLLRVLGPQDRDKVVSAFDKLDPQSIYTRFFSHRKSLSEAELKRLDAIDPLESMAVGAFVGSGADETLVGAGSYVALPVTDGARTAEVAFLVEEDFHGQGLAGQLLAALTGIARQHGFQRLEAVVLSGNASMLRVFERSGLPLARHKQGGEMHIVMELGAAAGNRR